MKKVFFDSLKRRIVLLGIIAVALSTGIVGCVIMYFNYSSILGHAQEEGLLLAKSHAKYIAEKAQEGMAIHELQQTVADLAASYNLGYCAVLDENGVDIADNQIEYLGVSFGDDESVQEVINAKSEKVELWRDDKGREYLTSMVPLNLNVGGYEAAVMDVGINWGPWEQMMVDSTRRNMIIAMAFVVLFGVALSVLVERGFNRPLNDICMATRNFTNGVETPSLDIKCKGEMGELRNSLMDVSDRIRLNLIGAQKIANGSFDLGMDETSHMDPLSAGLFEMKNTIDDVLTQVDGVVKELLAGNLSVRLNEKEYQGKWKTLILDLNSLIEALVTPLYLGVDSLQKIGKGEIPQTITEEYKGDFNDLKYAINSCVEGLSGLVDACAVLSQMRKNDYSGYVETGGSGLYKDIAESVNAIQDQNHNTVRILNNIAEGDLGDLPDLQEAAKKNENDMLLSGMVRMAENIMQSLDGVEKVKRDVEEGIVEGIDNLDAYEGEWKKLISNLNDMILAFGTPLHEVIAVMDAISNGDLRKEVEGEYKGGFDTVKQKVNLTSNRLTVVVGEISEYIKQIAEGNLTLPGCREYRGDFVEISNSINTILNSLNQVFLEIDQAAEDVAGGANQLSIGGQTLSQGATEQASAIQELNASIAEIAGQTRQNAINATQASELAEEAKNNAFKGNEQMKDMLQSMKEINEASSSISKIIKVIDDIAFQTNILALNAAVEAARAGQHGKGFAVVAEEVRSADAARETTDLIEGTIDIVRKGGVIANDTAGSLSEIVKGIEKSANLLKEIAEASNEQATNIAQINGGVDQIAQVVQHNSATAEESAASSEELSQQAELLKGMVARFHLRGNAEIKRLTRPEKPKIQLPELTIDLGMEPTSHIEANYELTDKY